MIFSDTTGVVIAKFVVTLLLAAIAFWGLAGNTFSMVFVFALVVTFINYLVGDLTLLPRAGNVVATIVDGVLAGAIALAFDLFSAGFQATLGSVLLFGVLTLIVEAVFHIFMQKADKVFPS